MEVMGAPSWAVSSKFATVVGRLQHQKELDEQIEAWSQTLSKYELTERCQAAGVRALPVQSAEDRVEDWTGGSNGSTSSSDRAADRYGAAATFGGDFSVSDRAHEPC